MATSSVSSSTATLASPGLGSGLDVNAIVQKLMTVESQPLNALTALQTTNQTRISAFGALKSALGALQGTMGALATASGLQSFSTTLSDSSALRASVGSGAVAGSYNVSVSQLAQGQKLSSAGFASTTAPVGTGTLTFDFGSVSGNVFTSNGGGAKSVTIPTGADSLTGIRDAVNAAKIGVTASIVNDGSASGNRLVFTSTATGATNTMKITVTDGDGTATDTAGLSQLAYDPAAAAGLGKNMSEVQAGKNALFSVDGIAMSKASNTVSDAIQGVTLTLVATNAGTLANPGTPTTVTVGASSDAVSKGLSSFVTAYNNLDTLFDNLTKYDAPNKKAATLTGDSTVRTIQSQLRQILGSALPGGGTYTTLSQAGLSFQSDGSLALDTSKLNAALSANPDAVTRLFAAVGTATDSLASVGSFSDKTKVGTYDLNVTRLATRGQLAGSAAAGLTIATGINDTLKVTVDGVTSTLTLRAGTYADAGALATDVQAQINGVAAISKAGSSLAISASGGVLAAVSNRYGSSSAVTVSGNAAATLFGAAPTATTGLDIQGTIGGVAATGSGQTLFGGTGSAAEGLRVTVTGGATGARGAVDFGRGFAARLSDMLGAVIDGKKGMIASRTDGLTKQNADLEKRKTAMNLRLSRIEANYTAQFNALDTMMASLTAQSNALSQALVAVSANTPGFTKSGA